MEKTIHQGRNIRRFREMLGVKQENLAMELNLSQQTVSALEQKEALDADMLEKIAKILKVPAEAIKNFDEEKVMNVIGNIVTTVNDHGTGQVFQFHPTINPIDKWMDVLEENKKLYERLLESEKEKNRLLQKLLDERK